MELVAAVIGSLRVEEPPADAPTPRAHARGILGPAKRCRGGLIG